MALMPLTFQEISFILFYFVIGVEINILTPKFPSIVHYYL